MSGAASGIGRATAARFVAEGATVGLVDRDASHLDEAAEELGRLGTVLSLPTDVAVEEQVAASVALLTSTLGVSTSRSSTPGYSCSVRTRAPRTWTSPSGSAPSTST